MTYSDFVNKELIHFSMMDNMRSIPSLVDGLKPGQVKGEREREIHLLQAALDFGP